MRNDFGAVRAPRALRRRCRSAPGRRRAGSRTLFVRSQCDVCNRRRPTVIIKAFACAIRSVSRDTVLLRMHPYARLRLEPRRALGDAQVVVCLQAQP